jgi:hypothetical protein
MIRLAVGNGAALNELTGWCRAGKHAEVVQSDPGKSPKCGMDLSEKS